MKKLLSLGASDCLSSLMPIVFWALMGFLFGGNYANGFIIGYPLQFVFGFLYQVLIVGSLKCELKKADRYNYFGAGLLAFSLISLGIMLTIHMFIDYVGLVFNYTDSLNKSLLIICGYLLVVDWVIQGIVKNYQYGGNSQSAFTTILAWYMARFLCIFVTRFYLVDKIGLENALFVYVVTFVLGCGIVTEAFVSFSSMRFRLKEFIRYSSCRLMSNLGMFLVYLLGLRRMAGSEIFLSAYNTMSMSTDTQWDALSAIDTYVSIESIVGEWGTKSKRIFKDCFKYGIFLSSTSVLLLPLYSISLPKEVVVMAFTLFCIEMSSFLAYSLSVIMQAYIQVMKPGAYLAVIYFLKYVVRVSLQIFIPSLFGISIAVVGACAFEVLVISFVYIRYRR